jgi:hypothetical protein
MNDDQMADGHVFLGGPVGSHLLEQPADLNHTAMVEMQSGGLSLLPDGRETGHPGSVRGTVENGAGAGVVLLPTGGGGGIGMLVLCNPDGTFEAPEVALGEYWVGAFSGLDLEGLRDANLVQQLMKNGAKVRVMSGSSTQLTLKANARLD